MPTTVLATALPHSLADDAPLGDNEIIHLLTLGDAPYTRPEFANRFRHNALFIGPPCGLGFRCFQNGGRLVTACVRDRQCCRPEEGSGGGQAKRVDVSVGERWTAPSDDDAAPSIAHHLRTRVVATEL